MGADLTLTTSNTVTQRPHTSTSQPGGANIRIVNTARQISSDDVGAGDTVKCPLATDT